MPQKYLTVGGTATLVHYRGATTLPDQPPDTSRGACVVCVHDAGSTGGRFDLLLDALAPKNSPLAYDQPGHGRSGGLDSLGSVSAMANHLAQMADLWSLPDTVVVGEGLGASVALSLAASGAGWVKGLVLTGSVVPPADLDLQIAHLEQVTRGRGRRQFDRSGYSPHSDRPVYERAFADWVKTDPRTTLGDRRAQAEWENQYLSILGQVNIPTVVVVGQDQDRDESDRSRQLACSLAEGSVKGLDRSGRHGVVEQPEDLAVIVEEVAQATIGRDQS